MLYRIYVFLNLSSRASIWWKYLDQDSALPPPFTALYFAQRGLAYVSRRIQSSCKSSNKTKNTDGTITNGPARYSVRRQSEETEAEDPVEQDKREFEKRYRGLMLMLISPQAGKVNS